MEQILLMIFREEIDKRMFNVVAELNVPYILMHMRGVPKQCSI